MDLQVIVWLVYCFLLPAVLLTACLFRFNLLSLVYFLYLLLLPWFLGPNKYTVRGHTGRFIKTVFCTSLLFVLAHICFQTVLYTYAPLDAAIGYNCSRWEAITRHIGLSRLPLDDPWNVLRLLCPDVGVCVVSLVTIVLCRRLVRNREMVAAANITSLEEDSADTTTENEEELSDDEEEERSSNGSPDEVSTATKAKLLAEGLKVKVLKVLRDLGRVMVVLLLGVAGITLPSAFSTLYFLLFIGVCTWWACHLPISHLGFNALCVMVGFYTAGHMVCLYLYQSPLGQAAFPPQDLWARSRWYPESQRVQRKLRLQNTSAPEAPKGPLNESPFFLLGRVVMQQSYVCALIAMMVWSITYHSWLTFVLLLWACLIWMLRSRRHAATLCSPFILLYGLALCCLQYVWAIDLEPILPTKVGTMSLRQLGLDRAEYPCLRLGAMLLFTLTFWLLVRQSVKENFRRKSKRSTPLQEVTTKELGAGGESVLKVLGGMVMSCYAKYWIYVCGGMFIMVSFAGKLVAYKIVYMLLFLLCLCLYQVYYSLWRHLLKLFWWLVVAYTMLVLISIYTYQFEDFPKYWKNLTGFTDDQLAAIGLETFALSELFSSILIPGFFLLACILQLHYFHKPFMRITDLDQVTPIHRRRKNGRPEEASSYGLTRNPEEEEELMPNDEEESEDEELVPTKWGLVMDRILVLSRKFSDILSKVQGFLWRILELHILKMVAFFSVWVALQEPSVMNLVLVVLWSLAMPFGRFRPMASCLSTVWVCVIIVCKMLYQLSVVDPSEYARVCTMPPTNETNLSPEEMMNSTLYQPIDPAKWFGIRKDTTALGYSKCCANAIPGTGITQYWLCSIGSYLDMVKVLVFRYFFWFVLSVVFITGATRISVFGLGYLIASFFFLLFGTKLLVRPSRVRLMLWDCLIIYNVAVIISKNALSILACVFVTEMQARFCWVIQLFSLVCTVKGYYDAEAVSSETCSLPVEEAGILWDSLCLLCLLLQRRVFLSFYFLHVTTELQAFAKQASRGFELFRASIMKNVHFHQQIEKKSLTQLKKSMQRIRAKQQKYKEGQKSSEISAGSQEVGSDLSSPVETHGEQKKSKKKNWYQPWINHAAVIHSGDYYLFESDSEDEEDLTYEEKKPQTQTACQLAYQAWVSSVKTALRERQRRQRQWKAMKEKERNRQEQREEDLHLKASADAVFEEPDAEEEEPEEEEESVHGEMVQKILDILRFLWAIILAMVDGLTQWLNLLTKQYRDTSTVLCNERYFIIHRIQQRRPAESREDLVSQNSEIFSLNTSLDQEDPEHASGSRAETPRRSSNGNLLTEEVLQPEPLKLRHSRTASEILSDRAFFIEELEQSREFFNNQNRLLRLLIAVYNLLSANSELLCYLIIVLNNVVSASVISLVLPMLVFLWAMLSAPRPTKRFWMTAIVYTEAMVVLKYIFQFGFFPWNSLYEMTLNEDKPFFPPRIFGLEKTDSYIKYDLLQLLALFFHRSLLMQYGLWDHEGPLEEQVASPEDGQNIRAGEENGSSKGEAQEAKRKDQDNQEPGTSMAAAAVMRHDAAEDLPARPQNEREKEPRNNNLDLLDVMERDGKELQEEVPKKNSSIRLRRKNKKAKNQDSKESLSELAESATEPEKKPKDKKSDATLRLIAVGHKIQQLLVRGFQGVKQPAQRFFRSITKDKYRASTDVYALMFLTDVIDFVIIIFGFWAFGKHSAAADIASSLSEDQVPEAFLVMLLIQFSTMIIDRALYLRKAVLGKLIFQVILVLGIHLWMFFILPAVTERKFNQNFVAQLWYFVKCIYFGLSAYQIRCGYPTRILGNVLTKKYNHLNLFLFQGFRLVPFLVELRAVMDWVWTDTTLSLSDWMCVEDIYANIFIIKCSRETEKKYPQPKGQKKKKIVKYGMGGLIIFFLICIIWFPLLFISLVRSVVGVVNHPIDVTVTFKLGGYEPLFTMSVQQQSIKPFTAAEYEQLTKTFGDNAKAMQFITLYSYEDIVTAMIEGSSGSVWRISPPSRQEVVKELLGSPMDLTLRLAWTFQRDLGKGGTVEHTFGKHSIDLEPGNPVRAELASLLIGNRTEPVLVPNMFPNYMRAPNGADAKPVSQLYKDDEDDYQDITLSLMSDRTPNSSGNQEWWDIAIARCKPASCTVLPMVIFNDKVSPPSLGFLAGYGIMGLYVSVVLVIGKFVRGFFSEISHSIMFEELPCVDRILKLCTDIFLVRETGELELEEELYSKLIFLYRSPETMIKWTRDIHLREQD
ncbi:PREDICTED: piezo-type mechanosensitive ion channel component 1 [Cyprinodon variegatus]|uniref:piezo-type mechanosensitive ion channel component 1 n=1 Tax=Cyprinodon variegatus TaxID=28743 RepID=UPI0007428631|nr:PREDICTED: piezo-type mechanosensitive ion channel component 1 [Cyprinodon variegatus]